MNTLLSQIVFAISGTEGKSNNRNLLLKQILIALGDPVSGEINRNLLLEHILTASGGDAGSSKNRNQLLADIVIQSGGTVRNENIRNWLLEDWLTAVGVPADALAFYKLSQSDLDSAKAEKVGGELSLYHARDSESNILQSSSNTIRTFDDNVAAFNVGRGLATQGEAVNVIPDSQDFEFGDWSTTDAATVTNGFSSPDGGTNAYLLDSSTSGQIFTNLGSQPQGDWAATIFLKAPQGESGKYPIKIVVNTGSTVTLLCDLVDSEFRRFSMAVDNDTGSDQILLYRLGQQSVSGSTLFRAIAFQADLVNSSFPSSEIYTSGGVETRAPDNNQIATLLQVGVWKTRQVVVLGDLTQSALPTTDFNDGVSGANLTFGGLTTGTFDTLIAAGIDEARGIGSNGVVITIGFLADISTVRWTIVTNNTGLSDLDAVRQGFGNNGDSLNKWTIDFIPSDYDTGDFAADTQTVADLMKAADISNFAVDGVWNTGKTVVSSTYVDGGVWLNGINTGSSQIRFNLGVSGTFPNLVATEWNDAVGTGTNGTTIRIAPQPSAVITYTVLTKPDGLTDAQAVQQGFQNTGDSLNKWTIDFTLSDYNAGDFPTNTATVTTLLDDAGYTVADFPAAMLAEQWPVTDFELEFNFIWNGASDTFARVFENKFSDSQESVRIERGSGETLWNFIFITGGSALTASGPASPLVVGKMESVKVRVTSAGTIVSVNGVDGTLKTSLTSVKWVGNLIMLFRNLADTRSVNSECATITLKDLS